jgi:hypothetical protein
VSFNDGAEKLHNENVRRGVGIAPPTECKVGMLLIERTLIRTAV